ncbi:MAG TPA: hypothetical protein PLG34_08225 [Spirochaetota bacterium]|jgi:hypothetical protein|nr:hypothetical protein [Spirochaetota bacterium]HNZ27529.1 hypothetical protein [Spirochaetota bacterium]HPY87951.1 hypothetical protein [Spirochaetota bacterium]HQB60129.1 hypothetical protein [Spirochaetota bacterium]
MKKIIVIINIFIVLNLYSLEPLNFSQIIKTFGIPTKIGTYTNEGAKYSIYKEIDKFYQSYNNIYYLNGDELLDIVNYSIEKSALSSYIILNYDKIIIFYNQIEDLSLLININENNDILKEFDINFQMNFNDILLKLGKPKDFKDDVLSYEINKSIIKIKIKDNSIENISIGFNNAF